MILKLVPKTVRVLYQISDYLGDNNTRERASLPYFPVLSYLF
jgi:hypothetical protein